MNKRVIIIFFFTAFLLPAISFAQSQDCSLSLKNAQKRYDEGLLDNVVETISPCLNVGAYTIEEKLRAYKLIILSYIFDDKKAEADDAMLKLLKLEPEYKPNTNDPIEFINLFNSFRTQPLYSVGLAGGINFSHVNDLESYGVYSLNDTRGKYSYAGLGYQAGAKFNFYLKDQFELSTELLVMGNKFQFKNSMFGFANLTIKETQTNLMLPVSVTYDITRSKIRPFVRAGFNLGYLLADNATFTKKYSDNTFADVTGPPISLKTQHTKFNYGAMLGAGVKYSIKRAYIIFDVRYNIGLNNQVIDNKRYSNSELVYKYDYVSDNFSLQNVTISIGYSHSIYKVKKKTEKN